MKTGIPLLILAAVCILMSPALSMPENRCAFDAGHHWMQISANNMTKEEINNNMTVGQLRDLKIHALCNATGKSKDCQNNHSCANCLQKDNCLEINAGKGDNKGHFDAHGMNERREPMAKGAVVLLLMNDLTAEKLNNMTPAQIEELKQQKMAELNNMTLAQIKDLKTNRMEEQDKMTYAEFRTKMHEYHQISSILGFGHRAEIMPGKEMDTHPKTCKSAMK